MRIKPAGPIARLVLDIFCADAVYSFRRIAYVRQEYLDDASLIAHEKVHDDQRMRDGFLIFWCRIVGYYLWYGYEDSPYEIEARAKAGQH